MIQHFIITVLVIYGIHASTRDGMILDILPDIIFKIFFIGVSGKSGDVATSKRAYVAHKLSKALFDCTPCMSSVYGSLSFFLVEFPMQVCWLPVWVFSLAGANYLISKIINR